jgi:hypothetical protein
MAFVGGFYEGSVQMLGMAFVCAPAQRLHIHGRSRLVIILGSVMMR